MKKLLHCAYIRTYHGLISEGPMGIDIDDLGSNSFLETVHAVLGAV